MWVASMATRVVLMSPALDIWIRKADNEILFWKISLQNSKNYFQIIITIYTSLARMYLIVSRGWGKKWKKLWIQFVCCTVLKGTSFSAPQSITGKPMAVYYLDEWILLHCMLLVSYIQQYLNTSITVLTNQVWKLLIALFKVPNTGLVHILIFLQQTDQRKTTIAMPPRFDK